MAKGGYYFPLYYQRLLTSTVGWKDDEFGAYLKLLIYQFDKGAVPDNMDEIGRISKVAKKKWELIGKKFKPDGNGGLKNQVMDEIREDILGKIQTNIENGKRGGRPRKKTGKIEISINNQDSVKPNGYENNNRNETETKPIPITNNQEPIIERDNTRANEILESNLFRKPRVPTKQEVWEVFNAAGGTKDQAKSFYEKYEGVGWYAGSTPITNFIPFAHKFIDTWKRNDSKKQSEIKPTAPPLKTI